jgi:hypothetical protein
MPNDRDLDFEVPSVLHSWGSRGVDSQEAGLVDTGLWFTGGAALVAWTALALLLTA